MRGWEEKPLKSLLREPLRNGLSPSARGTITKRVLTISSVTHGIFDETKSKEALLDHAPDPTQYVQAGDLLICRGNGNPSLVGAGRLVKAAPGVETVFPDTLIAARLDHTRVDAAFVELVWNAPLVRSRISSAARTTNGTFKVNQGSLEAIRVPLPPLPEQRRIAALLDQADALRRKRREAVALVEQLATSAFLEMFGDPVSNPRGWPVRKLEDVAEIRSGVAKGPRADRSRVVTVPYLRVANVQDGFLNLTEVKDIELYREEVARFLLKPGDVLVTEGGDPDKLGRGAVWEAPIEPCVHQNHIFVVRPNPVTLLPHYTSAQLGSTRGKAYFLRAAKQTTGIASINKTQLSQFPVLIPPLKEQQRWAEFRRGYESLRERSLRRLAETDTLFHGLAQRAFRGEL